jgi:hypothetical protein
VQENPTIDEVIHLPAGISYWQRSTFRLYHHNPPLVKLVAALPVIVSGVHTDGLYQPSFWRPEPPNKFVLAHLFAYENASDYFELFTRARLVMPLFTVVGGLVVFAWSRRLYGGGGGLLSLALWVFCPNILAHARLVTTDVAATALGVLATYSFWCFLKVPSWSRAALAGLALGLAELTKFSLVLLYGVWPVLGAVHLLIGRDDGDRKRRVLRGVEQGALILVVSIVVIDAGYAFEGVGRRLGDYEFVCAALTRPVAPGMARPQVAQEPYRSLLRFRGNRFRDTWLGQIPMPLPAHYLLGFDDQKMEAEGIPEKILRPDREGIDGEEVKGYPVYLDGVLSQKSWWYYYLLALVYKVPEGTWLLVTSALAVLVLTRRVRAPWFDELCVLAMPAVVLIVISVFTNIGIGVRYVLPIFPYAFIAAGRLVPWAEGMSTRVGRWLARAWIGLGLAATATATLAVAPHYLAYFNLVSGGPAHGSDHLIDSNLDWGQDLVGLRRWLAAHAPGQRVGLAYFGQINPAIFDMRPGESFEWFLPPPVPGTIRKDDPLPSRDRFGPRPARLQPGLYAVSASLARGLPWRVYDNARWLPYSAWEHAFEYFHTLTPIARIGYSIFVYRVTEGDAARLAPLWDGEKGGPG